MSADDQISFEKGIRYWEEIPATIDGVLGGFGNSAIPRADIIGSKTFIRSFLLRQNKDKDNKCIKYGCDIGAGIGRITKNFLADICEKIDLVEPVGKFCDQIEIDLSSLIESKQIGNIYRIGMQDFVPEKEKYWLIWCQWCVGHLKDKELIDFLIRCKNGLQKNGIIVIKENISAIEDEFDQVDFSVTRTDESFQRIFSSAGMVLVKSDFQKGFPKTVYPVKMYALYSK